MAMTELAADFCTVAEFLQQFGIDDAERARRLQIYQDDERKTNRKAPDTKVKPPEAKKLKAKDLDKFAQLFNTIKK